MPTRSFRHPGAAHGRPRRPGACAIAAELRRRRNGAAAAAALAAVLGFAAFLPYPAIPYGENSAIQVGNLVVLLLAAPALFVSWWGRPYFLAPLVVAPLCLSLFKVALTGGTGLDLCFKSIIVFGLSALTLIAVQRVAPGGGLWLMVGMAAATLLHVAVGLWQWYSFSRGTLPLQGLYVNPSFLSVQDNAETIVRYIRRPFGLFPEPSAMSSSLAPWAVFWIAEAFGLVKLRRRPARWQRALFVTAAAGAVGLIILSKSGHAAVTLAAIVACAVAWLARARATAGTYLAIVAVFCVALPLTLWLGGAALGERVGRGPVLGEGSWRDRTASLGAGLRLLADGDAATWLFGLGPGLTTPAIRKSAGYEAVWSVLLPYLYQTGVIGAAAVGCVGCYFARVWRASGYGLVFALMLLVWLVGITLTTSYGQLLPPWVAMGWLSVWPAVCAPAGGPPAARTAFRRRLVTPANAPGRGGRVRRRTVGTLPNPAHGQPRGTPSNGRSEQ